MHQPEEVAIAALGIGGYLAEEILTLLTDDDLISDEAKDIFAMCREKYERNGAVSLSDFYGTFEKQYQAKIMLCIKKHDYVARGFTGRELVSQLKHIASRIKLADLGRNLAMLAERDDFTADEILDTHLKQISGVSVNDQGPASVSEHIPGYLKTLQERNERGGEILGLETGFPVLDRRYNGFKPGDMVIIAGRPSMGKTTMAQNIFDFNTVERGKVGLFFSMETDEESLLDKSIANLGKIPLEQIQTAECAGNDYASMLTATISRLKNSTQFYDTRGGLSPAEVRASCYQVKRKHGLDFVVIDYLQLMRTPGNGQFEQITVLSSEVKRLAKDLKIPFIVLSQLSRNLEQRNDKRPQMSDLRGSGSLEQDADIIIFPYRDSQYNENSPYKNVAEIITAKFKKGRVGRDYLVFQGDQSAFRNCDMSAAEIERMIALAEHQQQGAKKTSAMSMG